MRRHIFITALAVALALTVVALPTAIGQEGQQPAKIVNGSLKSVDLDESKIVVQKEDDSEVTLVLTEDTDLRGPGGESQTLATLAGKEGTMLTARFVERGEQNVALAIRLIA